MPKAYVIGIVEDISDPDGFGQYRAAAFPTVAQYQAKPLAIGDNPKPTEGTLTPASLVVLEFENVEAARRWYASPEYSAAIPIRQKSAKATLFIVEGIDLPA